MRDGVLILTRDADDYLERLAGLAADGVGLQAASTPQQALAVYAGEPVVLGQPDLVAAVLERFPEVRWVQSTWAGVRPLLELARRDYLLTGVKEVFGPQMAEYVFGHLLAREIRLAERRARQDRREWWAAESGTLEGKRIGIMGTGSIGRHVARVAAAFDLRVCGYNRSGRAVRGFERVYPVGRLTDFLADLDYLVCVLPNTPGTRKLLDERAFRALRPGCVLVNIGRGNLIDEPALLAAIERGDVAAAVLDVFAEEPLPPASPLWDAPGVTVTAHVSGISRPADIARLFEANYNRWATGETPDYVIDFEQGY